MEEPGPMTPGAGPLTIPPELAASVARHQAHLTALIASLRAAGIDEDTVAASVRTLVDSYADELTDALREMLKAQHHG
ncbi:hypothetical protein [Sphingomonas melonis]|uniref:Uncharacterized protein n=1 Tax=Sphingomonas melonis TaxID=152682 RepID=A0A7Y9FRB7_9SPHN|nr:hypothetical protein [Sphingomonas melonis]NYD92024.1 hypothetical protein [Sphingomonas melonis]